MLGFEGVDVHTWIALIALRALALCTVAVSLGTRLFHLWSWRARRLAKPRAVRTFCSRCRLHRTAVN